MAGEGWWKRTDEIYEPVRIGEGLVASGELGREPMARAMATLDVFAQFARASGLAADSIDAVATSAIRDAANAEDFLARARERSRLPIRVLSREAEARYGYLAAVNSTTLERRLRARPRRRLDAARARRRSPGRAHGLLARGHGAHERALPAGQRPGQAPPAAGAVRARRRGARAGAVAERCQGAERGGRLVGIGGTVRNLASAAQRAAGLPTFGVQGAMLGADALGELIERLAALPAAERASVPGIKPARADLILAGAVVVQGVLRGGRLRRAGGDRGGPARGRVLRATARRRRARPRLPLFADVRRASVLNLAGQYHFDSAHTRHVAALALGMFDELAQPRPARRRRARARAAVGGEHAARHRHVGRLRRPSQALALSDPQRRAAGLHARGGGDRRAGRALSPQGHARPGADARAVRRRRPRAPGPLRGAAAPGRGSRALARPARARARTWRSTTTASSCA